MNEKEFESKGTVKERTTIRKLQGTILEECQRVRLLLAGRDWRSWCLEMTEDTRKSNIGWKLSKINIREMSTLTLKYRVATKIPLFWMIKRRLFGANPGSCNRGEK